tara:strand:- start:9 stop:677 length:669 start_codon:yes stop_codon:yes gene_type:complete
MYFEPGKTKHNLPHDPFKSCVIPRPIGWISTLSADGIPNLAPFSQFQNLTFDPPYVMFSANQKTTGLRKDSAVNAEQTGEFVWNMATYELRESVNITGMEVAPDRDEFELANLTKTTSHIVKPPRVAESPIHFECAYHSTTRLPGNGKMGSVDIIFGKVLVVHIDDDVLTKDGLVDVLKIRPIARLGYYDYTSIESVFQMEIPTENEGQRRELLRGLEGRPE